MSVYIEILEGPQAGEKIPVEEALFLNWKANRFELSEQPSKNLSAKLHKNNRGLLYLETDSDLLTLEINSSRVKKIHLLPGIFFRMNGISLRVIPRVAELRLNSAIIRPELPTDDLKKKLMDFKAPGKPKAATKSWRALLSEHFKKMGLKNSPEAVVKAFSPALELEFVEGFWSEKRIPLFFGPRTAGFGHLDLDLEDPEAPDLAFEIYPTDSGLAEIVNRSGFKLLINKKSFERRNLNDGDLITVGQSMIKVNYLEST